MDPQVVQQLTQLLQQMLQVVQGAGGGGGDMADPSMGDPMADPSMGGGDPGMDPSMMDDGGGDMPDAEDGTMDKGMGGGYGKPMMKMDDSDMGGVTLHDRLARVEQHVGLKKSASTAPLIDRVAQLEEAYLGEEYEGPMAARVEQLEVAILGKSAATATKGRGKKQQPTTDEAPDVIPLDALIKSAIVTGIQQGLQQQGQAVDDDEIPPVKQMRKAAAKRQQATYGQSRRQTHQIQGDPDLSKAAASFGYGADEDLDAPIGLADMLLLQYSSLKGGLQLPDDD